MGPAYFPVVLGGILAFLGLLVLIDSLVEEGPAVSKFHFRPLLFIAVSSLAFAYLLKAARPGPRFRGAGVHQRLRGPRIQVEGGSRS
jgi:hypothetical protein